MALYCPLLKEECKLGRCAWFDTLSAHCGIAGIPEAIVKTG